MAEWSRISRNIAGLVFFATLAAMPNVSRADVQECNLIFPVEMGEECITDPLYGCFSMFGSYEEWCGLHEDDTCADFCGGGGNVVNSDCWYEGNLVFGGMHTVCSSEFYIWCECSESSPE